MHIAYLDPHPVPDDIPEALQILYTVDALAQSGANITLITPRPRKESDAIRLLSHSPAATLVFSYVADLRKRWYFPFSSNRLFYIMALRRLSRLSVDAVLVRNLKMAEAIQRLKPELPVFFETHELFAKVYEEEHGLSNGDDSKKLEKLKKRERYVYEHSRGLVTLTAMLAEDIASYYKLATPACVAPDGVDLSQAEQPVDDVTLAGPALVYLGSLHKWKGVESLIEAMPHVGKGVLHIVGGNEERIAELKQLANQLGVEPRVEFHGHVPPERRFAYIKKASVCLLPLTNSSIAGRYTSPLKLFEYMAMAKPIVAADLPSIRDVIQSEKNALLVPVGDAKAVATAINRLLTGVMLAANLGQAARQRANDFTWLARAEKIKNFMAEHL